MSARMSKGVFRQWEPPKNPIKHGAKCYICPLRGQEPVWGDGPKSALFAFVGEAPGRDEATLGIPFCLAPETLVLMRDLTWRALANVHVGDWILTVSEEAQNGNGISGQQYREWRFAQVTAKSERLAERFRVTTDDGGEIVASREHRFLNGRPHNKKIGAWLRVDQLLQSDSKWNRDHSGRASRLVRPFKPWSTNRSREAGYLAGFFDGEGHVSGSRGGARKLGMVGFSQNEGPTLQHVRAVATQFNFDFVEDAETRKNGKVCVHTRLRGGFNEVVRFLGSIRPTRLLADFDGLVTRIGRGFRRSLGETPRVLRRESIGEGRLIDITTTAGTFIANGFVVHNCGSSGELLTQWVEKVYGLKRTEVWFDNAVMCLPPGGDMKAFLQKARKEHRLALAASRGGATYVERTLKVQIGALAHVRHPPGTAAEILKEKKRRYLERDEIRRQNPKWTDRQVKDELDLRYPEPGDTFPHPVDCCRERLLWSLGTPRCKACGKFIAAPDAIVCRCVSPKPVVSKERLNVPYVVPMGNSAMLSLLGFEGISERRGYVYDAMARRRELAGVPVKPGKEKK